MKGRCCALHLSVTDSEYTSSGSPRSKVVFPLVLRRKIGCDDGEIVLPRRAHHVDGSLPNTCAMQYAAVTPSVLRVFDQLAFLNYRTNFSRCDYPLGTSHLTNSMSSGRARVVCRHGVHPQVSRLPLPILSFPHLVSVTENLPDWDIRKPEVLIGHEQLLALGE